MYVFMFSFIDIIKKIYVQSTFEVNVFGTISLTKLVAPHMLKQGGGHFVVVRGGLWPIGIISVNVNA